METKLIQNISLLSEFYKAKCIRVAFHNKFACTTEDRASEIAVFSGTTTPKALLQKPKEKQKLHRKKITTKTDQCRSEEREQIIRNVFRFCFESKASKEVNKCANERRSRTFEQAGSTLPGQRGVTRRGGGYT